MPAQVASNITVSSTDFISISIALIAAFSALVIYIVKVKDTASLKHEESRNEILREHEEKRDQAYKETTTTIFGRIDENRVAITDLDSKLNKDYHDKREIKEYIELQNAPYLQQILFINEKLDKITELVRAKEA